MSLECFIVDIDGFAGQPVTDAPPQQVIVPREAGIVHLSLGEGKKARICSSQGFYFYGGLSPKFVKLNMRSFSYQTRCVHGYPRNDNSFCQSLPATATAVQLSSDPQEAARDGAESLACCLAATAAKLNSALPILLVHKGGNEKDWLAPLARQIAAGRAGDVRVFDLNDLSCPKVSNLLYHSRIRAQVDAVCRCTAKVHGSLRSRYRDWARHCPQAECLALAAWISAECTWDVSRPALGRAPTLSTEELDRLITRICQHQTPPPVAVWIAAAGSVAARARCENYVRAALARVEAYIPPEGVTAFVCQRGRALARP